MENNPQKKDDLQLGDPGDKEDKRKLNAGKVK